MNRASNPHYPTVVDELRDPRGRLCSETGSCRESRNHREQSTQDDTLGTRQLMVFHNEPFLRTEDKVIHRRDSEVCRLQALDPALQTPSVSWREKKSWNPPSPALEAASDSQERYAQCACAATCLGRIPSAEVPPPYRLGCLRSEATIQHAKNLRAKFAPSLSLVDQAAPDLARRLMCSRNSSIPLGGAALRQIAGHLLMATHYAFVVSQCGDDDCSGGAALALTPLDSGSARLMPKLPGAG